MFSSSNSREFVPKIRPAQQKHQRNPVIEAYPYRFLVHLPVGRHVEVDRFAVRNEQLLLRMSCTPTASFAAASDINDPPPAAFGSKNLEKFEQNRWKVLHAGKRALDSIDQRVRADGLRRSRLQKRKESGQNKRHKVRVREVRKEINTGPRSRGPSAALPRSLRIVQMEQSKLFSPICVIREIRDYPLLADSGGFWLYERSFQRLPESLLRDGSADLSGRHAAGVPHNSVWAGVVPVPAVVAGRRYSRCCVVASIVLSFDRVVVTVDLTGPEMAAQQAILNEIIEFTVTAARG